MDPRLAAFHDELEKIAASGLFSPARSKQFAARTAGKIRSKVRPRKATTVIAQSKNKHKLGEYIPGTQSSNMSNGATAQELQAKKPRQKGDVPSREDMDTGPNRMDGRGNAATVMGPSVQLTDVGVTPAT